MAGSKQSKTAKASVNAGVKKGNNGFERSTDANLFIQLSRGDYAYVSTLEGKTTHVKVSSDAFTAAVADLYAARPAQTVIEIEANEARHPGRGWQKALDAALTVPGETVAA